jgi:hypothetical protein
MNPKPFGMNTKWLVIVKPYKLDEFDEITYNQQREVMVFMKHRGPGIDSESFSLITFRMTIKGLADKSTDPPAQIKPKIKSEFSLFEPKKVDEMDNK